MQSVIIHSDAAIRIVTEPFLVGDELLKLAIESSRDCIRFLAELDDPLGAVVRAASVLHSPASIDNVLGNDTVNGTSVSVLHILNGGRFYGMESAWAAEFPDAARASLVSLRAKRYLHETNGWQVRVWERSGAFPSDGVLLIGDTVATGATLAGVLDLIVHEAVTNGTSLPHIVIFTIAGAAEAKQRLQGVDALYWSHTGRHLLLTYANAEFHLNNNGTDLEFCSDPLDPSSQLLKSMHADARAYISEKLGPFARHMKCAVWDWAYVKHYDVTIDTGTFAHS
eukprot:Opistho-2@56147